MTNAAGSNRDAFVPPRSRAALAREARCFVAIYLALAAGSFLLGTAALFWLWLLPVLLGEPFLRVYLLAEHTGCPHVPAMLRNTRTTFTTALVRFLAWNMPFHVEHHAWPCRARFHKLPAVHDILREAIWP